MPTLILTRSEQADEVHAEYRIVIDDKYVTSIGTGKSAEIELSTGHHLIQIRAGFRRSVPAGIEAAPEGVYHLTVGPNSLNWRKKTLFLVLNGLVVCAIAFLVETDRDLTKPSGSLSWVNVILLLCILLLSLLLTVSLTFWWINFLYLIEIKYFVSRDKKIVDSFWTKSLRFRVSIRQTMFAVALLAVMLSLGIEETRNTKQDDFRKQASAHESLEGISRKALQRQIQTALYYEGQGWDSTLFRQAAAKSSAKAEYHAAMRRKYEGAASDRLLSIEPDPPEPIAP